MSKVIFALVLVVVLVACINATYVEFEEAYAPVDCKGQCTTPCEPLTACKEKCAESCETSADKKTCRRNCKKADCEPQDKVCDACRMKCHKACRAANCASECPKHEHKSDTCRACMKTNCK
uniref:Vanadium-binding protein 2 n=1 Tax=Ascidia sydneiensis samea TaxID=79730 RepID=VBP2_ASCSS|nr:RecName: Full=Vanadium-binding protein 2; Flags: Precursor [Ascidia sydneiensis samea]BAC76458.1 vanadium-binding protein 2 [Ascidia sydneiensis samea]